MLEADEIAGLQVGGKWYSAGKDLILKSLTPYSGEDAIGSYTAEVMDWEL